MIRKFRDPSDAWDAHKSRPNSTILVGQDEQGTYWAIGVRGGFPGATRLLLQDDGAMGYSQERVG